MNDPYRIDKYEEDREQKEVLRSSNMEASDGYKRFNRFGSGSSKILPRAATPGAWDPNESYVVMDSSSENSTVSGGLGIKKPAQVRRVSEQG